jgi:hypothetical protein
MALDSSWWLDLMKILGIVGACVVVVVILSWWDGRF